jgi:hypothetical protein
MWKSHQRFWHKIGNNSAIGLSNIAKCNGNITWREKPPGKRKRI